MSQTSLHRDALRIRAVGPLLLRRGARVLLERVVFPALRPLTRLGFLGRDEAPADAPKTAWVPRRSTPEDESR